MKRIWILLFLVDMSDRWKYIFLINDQNPAASKELACKVLKIFFQNHIYCKVKESEMRCSIKNRVSAICKEHRLECSQPVKDLLQELLKRNFSECIVSALLDEVSQNSNRTINMDIIFKAISNRDSAVFYMLTRKECERFINIVEQQKENRYVEKETV